MSILLLAGDKLKDSLVWGPKEPAKQVPNEVDFNTWQAALDLGSSPSDGRKVRTALGEQRRINRCLCGQFSTKRKGGIHYISLAYFFKNYILNPGKVKKVVERGQSLFPLKNG